MKTSIVVYVALFAAIVCLGLVFFLPKFSASNPPTQPIPSIPLPTPVDTGTVSISIDPSAPAPVVCQWCGQNCEALGTSQNCQTVDPPTGYICQSVQSQGKSVCQSVLRTESSIVCDAMNACPDGKSCYSYTINGTSKNMCAGTDPCAVCPSKKCQIGQEAMYPGKVTCI